MNTYAPNPTQPPQGNSYGYPPAPNHVRQDNSYSIPPAPNPNYIQLFNHGYDPDNTQGRYNNWTGCICLMIWFGTGQLLGGIAMLIYGAILLSKYK